MPAATATYLAAHPGASLYALGGPAAAALPSATAVVGSDRFETALAVARAFFTAPAGVGLASGMVFPDALSGGADAAAQGWPMLITRTAELPSGVAQYVADTPSISRATVYGGPAAVQDSVLTALGSSLNG